MGAFKRVFGRGVLQPASRGKDHANALDQAWVGKPLQDRGHREGQGVQGKFHTRCDCSARAGEHDQSHENY